MKVNLCFLIAAIAASQFVDAGHHSSGNFVDGLRETVPVAIEESDRTKTCPHGFKPHGKHCVQTVKVQPTIHCPLGFFRSINDENVCAKFFEEVFECPAEFVREKGVCVRTRQVEPLVECPHGFKIMSDGRQCSRHVPLPNTFFCPHGSVKRGEICLKRIEVAPKFVCPPGFTKVEDKRCQLAETFDCTPSEVQVGKDAVASHKHHKHLRFLGEKHNKVSFVASKETPPVEKEFVVQKTCKRVRFESARKVCPQEAVHHGKECFLEEEVQLHEKHGGFKEEIVSAVFLCPEGHVPSSPIGRFHCLIKEEVSVKGFCPDNSEHVDHRCAKFRPLILRCPSDHKLEDGFCLRTIVAPPIVEFNVAFKCVGKDCDHQHPHSTKHNK